MKILKILILSVVFIGSPILLTITSIPTEAQYNSSSNWEYLGEVTAYDEFRVLTRHGKLYVKALGTRLMYKFIYEGKEYSVSKSSKVYQCNAQVTIGSGTWYLSVPEW